jgi:hypothetical protein
MHQAEKRMALIEPLTDEDSDEAAPQSTPQAALPATPAPATAMQPVTPQPAAATQPAAPQPISVAPQAAGPADPVKQRAELMQRIRTALEPHGVWLDHPRYGNMWRPTSNGSRFVPYLTDGHWTMAEGGEWSWVSDHDWGDVAMHYGNWVWTRETGWSWIPGTDYAPAHVVWRTGKDHVGWAPLSPMHYWIEDASVRQAQGALPFWFVPKNRLFDAKLREQLVRDRNLAMEILKHSKIYSPGASQTIGPVTPPVAALGLAALPRSLSAPEGRDINKSLQALEAENAKRRAKIDVDPFFGAREAPLAAKTIAPKALPEKIPMEQVPAIQRQERIEGPNEPARVCWFTNTWPRERHCRDR